MNWLTKISEPVGIFAWSYNVQKSIELLIPGKWKIHPSSWLNPFREICLLGEDILIKPNVLFFVRTKMIGNIQGNQDLKFDSRYGHKDIHFECDIRGSVNDSPIWGDILGSNKYLDTPYEVANFVKTAINRFRSDEGGENKPEPSPDPSEYVPYNDPEEEVNNERELVPIRTRKKIIPNQRQIPN